MQTPDKRLVTETALESSITGRTYQITADGADAQIKSFRRLEIEDTAGAMGSVLDIEHHGDGTNNAGATYGLDIHNNPGARMGLVGHQYSNNGPFAQFDNTDSETMITVRQANNPTRNPTGAATGESATGDAFRVLNNDGGVMYAVRGRGEVYINSGLASTPGQTTHSLEINTATTGSYKAIYLRHNNPGVALQIDSASTAAGFYPVSVVGQNYGGNFATTTDGGSALQITKNGTGIGSGLIVTNKGTGYTAAYRDATQVRSAVLSTGEFEHFINGAGIILRSPNGTRYSITVSDDGSLTTTTI